MRRRVQRLFLFLTAAALATAYACRDAGQPTAAFTGPRLDRGGENPHLVACAAHGADSVSMMVGPHGQSIQLGNVHLVIPGNALSDSVLITVIVPADTLADVRFEPQGLQFSKGVNLQMSTVGCTLGGQAPIHVVYLDDNGTVLETLDGAFNGGAHTVTTKIHHFSSYAIAL